MHIVYRDKVIRVTPSTPGRIVSDGIPVSSLHLVRHLDDRRALLNGDHLRLGK